MEVKSAENISCKKRKLSTNVTLLELSDDESCLENCTGIGEAEITEPDNKISSLESLVPSQCSDSGIESLSYNSQSSLELLTHAPPKNCVDKNLLELEDQIQQLRDENESLKSKSCLCDQIQNKAIITIKFNDLDNFRLHKSKFLNIFSACVNIDVQEQESNLLLSVYEDETINTNEWVVVDEVDCVSPLNKHKKKKKKRSVSGSTPDIFTLDTTPSLSTKNNLQYERKFEFINDADKKDEKSINARVNTMVCFNCDEDHNLKDCTKPRDFNKINASRQKLKMQGKGNVYKRYHLDEDHRYSHLQPGKISNKLQDALGLQSYQLPEYIYRMRRLGYPPGWYNEVVSVSDPSLVLIDFNGKVGNKSNNVEDLSLDKIIDYHGFNIPLQKGYKDEYRMFGCSPYSKEWSKQKMINHLLSTRKEEQDNLESCDMDIDNNPSDKELEAIHSGNQPNETKVTVKNISPTLVELESEKEKLLAQLTEDVNDSQENLKDSSNIVDVFVTIDSTGTIEDLNLTSNTDASTTEELVNGSEDLDKTLDSTKLNIIKTSTFGTPILKSSSPYSRLPNFNNFTKNVSDVINFENLPNSTGKYDQMIGVIEKVRTTLKNIQDKQL